MISFSLPEKKSDKFTAEYAKVSRRIIFMGTPEFAVASLAAILDAGHQVVAVVTAPDKPGGRGMKLQQSAVKKFAVEKGLHILQPEKLKAPEFIQSLKDLQADLQVVVAFRMLPEVIWSMPPLGTINLHGSLLPQYRGAAPIHWAVINGEKETGVTTFKLQQAIDTGNILLQEKLPIAENETTGEVHDKMMLLGAEVLVKTIDGIFNNSIQEIVQENLISENVKLAAAPKIFSKDCVIDFMQPMEQVHNFIRGLSPFPGAYTQLDGKTLKIFRSEKQSSTEMPAPGTIQSDGRSFLRFACNDGFIVAKEVQLEGKKRLSVDNFLRGYELSADIISS